MKNSKNVIYGKFDRTDKATNNTTEIRGRKSKIKNSITPALPQESSWLMLKDGIPSTLAEDFLKSCIWWTSHSSGKDIRAPGFAKYIYLHPAHGFAVDFGANTFLIGKAIERCSKLLREYLLQTPIDELPSRLYVQFKMKELISGAVANNNGDEYQGSYPVTRGILVFGTHEISLENAANFMIRKSNVKLWR